MRRLLFESAPIFVSGFDGDEAARSALEAFRAAALRPFLVEQCARDFLALAILSDAKNFHLTPRLLRRAKTKKETPVCVDGRLYTSHQMRLTKEKKFVAYGIATTVSSGSKPNLGACSRTALVMKFGARWP